MNYSKRHAAIILALLFSILFLAALDASDLATLNVIPDQTVLSPALLKSPVTFVGSGYQTNELVIIELILPQGIKIKGLSDDENRVTLAISNVGNDGNFKVAMSAISTLNWFFQVDWTPGLMTPDFKQAKPLPPGKYEIEAVGGDSGKIGKAVLEILVPPEKK